MRPAPKTIEDEWGVACRDCKFTRKLGAAELNAHHRARVHSERYAGHRVRVTQTITKDEYVIHANTLPLDAPPF